VAQKANAHRERREQITHRKKTNTEGGDRSSSKIDSSFFGTTGERDFNVYGKRRRRRGCEHKGEKNFGLRITIAK